MCMCQKAKFYHAKPVILKMEKSENIGIIILF